MRMRKKPNLIPRMDRCRDRMIPDPVELRGHWRDLMPQARELRVELGCGKGRFTAETAGLEPDVLFVAVERVPDAMIVAMERVVTRLCGVSPHPIPDTATALPKQARYQLRYTRII